MARVIGFIGAGQLGGPTVDQLLGAGHHVQLYARRPEVRDAYRDDNLVTICDSPADAAGGAELVVVFVFSGEQLEELTVGPASILATMDAGSMLLVHTTVSAAALRTVSVAAQKHDVVVVDAPVSGTADDIRNRRLTVLLGGPADAVAECTAVVECYASTVIHVGELGAAMRVKLVNNIVFAAHVQLAAAASMLAESLDLDSRRTLDALLSCSGSSAAIGHLLRMGGDATVFGDRVAPYLRKDVAACLSTADELGVELGIIGDTARNGPLPFA